MEKNDSMIDAARTMLRLSNGEGNPGAMQGPVQVVIQSTRNIQFLPSRALSMNVLPSVRIVPAQIPTGPGQILGGQIQPPVAPAPASYMQALGQVVDQTDPAVTGQDRGEGASGTGKGKGKHWENMVQAGTFPKIHKDVQKWAGKRKEKEAEFKQYFDDKGVQENIPWKRETMNDSGNKLKVLYMYLIMLSYQGTVELVRGPVTDGLYGIIKIIVKKDKRPLFDAGQFTSSTSSEIYLTPKKLDPKYKEMYRLWQTAGFVETFQQESGDLEFEYKADVKQKVKDQVNETRRRKKERSETMEADV
jgi:hypothetical protein